MTAKLSSTLEILEELDRRPTPALGLGELRTLWASRRMLSRATAAGFALATALAFLIPARYTAVTQLMPPDQQSASNALLLAGMAEKAGGLGTMAGDLLGFKSPGALFVGMLGSRTIQDRLIEQFHLKDAYRVRLLEDARDTLSRNTSVVEDRKSGIITISLTDRNRVRAAAIANAYVSALNETAAQLSTSSARREREFLEVRLEAVKKDLSEAEGEFAQFSSQNSTLDIEQQGKAMLEATASLAGEWMAAQSELEGLRQIYTDNNARVRELSARVAELRKDLDRLSGQGNDAVPEPLNASSVKAHANADLPYPSIRKLPLLGARYADYYRKMKTQETVYEVLTAQYELAKVQEAKEIPSVRVLDPAAVPERKSYPPRLAMISMGTLAAFALSVAWILGVAHWQKIDSSDERKAFVHEVASATSARLQQWTRNPSGPRTPLRSAWSRFRRPPDAPTG